MLHSCCCRCVLALGFCFLRTLSQEALHKLKSCVQVAKRNHDSSDCAWPLNQWSIRPVREVGS